MISEAKKAANRKWDAANKDRKKYINLKSSAKRFINMAEYADLILLKEEIEKNLKKF